MRATLKIVSMDELLEQSDFVSLNLPYKKGDPPILYKERFEKMKDGARVLNAARGGAVVEADLVEALDSGKLRAAALDVFEDEPLPNDSPLKSMDNVMLAPHNANSSPEAWEAVHHSTIKNLINGLKESKR